jgi:hypothetical protein
LADSIAAVAGLTRLDFGFYFHAVFLKRARVIIVLVRDEGEMKRLVKYCGVVVA